MAKSVKALASPDLSKTFSVELLGAAIKAKRTQSGITQTDAAALCGIAKQTYIKIEQGRGDIRLSAVMDVMQGLGVQLSIKPWDQESSTESEANDGWV
ncbi:helix-turn-helix domain-containing protein [Shewanella youngdeokensis]|uniref:Helix-turn-helix transcriptional regulator n=1 Tax=Shewanella youngdeokensis TaxID=2999068 RepID=A0ABZ0K341_9GAMM|nr:helix-turn-helix transcriptional regulator [Shewanella sp. DAU334]